ncbi:hypothetical protein D3C76_753690 [compost metagenome]
MSIAAIIIEPYNNFYLPISTEAFFQRCWVPAIRELQLEIVSLFSDPGVDITISELPRLIKELELIQGWAVIKLAPDDLEHITKRINALLIRLPEIFRENNVTIYIG